MSKTTAPLLSIGASGQFAKTLVAATWKGVPYMRRYVVPANPNTAGQQAQRNAMSAAVAAYRNYITDTTARAALALAAGVSGKPQSGFNFFSSQAARLAATDPDGSMANDASEAANVVTVKMLNIDDGATGDEAGDFEIWTGSSPTSLLLLESKAIVAGDIVSSALTGDAGDIVYLKIRKGELDRSGIYKITLSGVA